ncbi:MAG: PmoA family protein [Planctomycetaceae bacterium]
MKTLISRVVLLFVSGAVQADDFVVQRCEVMPLADRQVAFRVDGVEKLRWHYGDQYPRPFFYPFNGPSGVSLTRMGHPGAQDHDHHRSVWFAYHKVNGIDFWSDQTDARIRQKHWYRYSDSDEEAIMASRLGWYDENGTEIMEQDIVAALRPLPDNEHALELQITFRPPQGVDSVSLDKTNFGPLAVRVSKTLSARFGGGQLTNSEGAIGEKNIFGRPARWMDYSGPVIVGQNQNRRVVREGITYFDHPANLRYPTHWHVRTDGWMGASFGMHTGHRINAGDSLVLRYLLYAHAGEHDVDRASAIHRSFAERPGFRIFRPGPQNPHLQYEVERLTKTE